MSARLKPEDREARVDDALEGLIDAAYARMVKSGATEGESRDAWTEMAVLIRRRSPTQIMRMELERRIAAKAKSA